jgi:hypothetical protein
LVALPLCSVHGFIWTSGCCWDRQVDVSAKEHHLTFCVVEDSCDGDVMLVINLNRPVYYDLYDVYSEFYYRFTVVQNPPRMPLMLEAHLCHAKTGVEL